MKIEKETWKTVAYLFTTRAGHVIKVVLCNPFTLQKA